MAKTVVNEHGGKQAAINERLDLIPPEALLRVGSILAKGMEKYGKDNWRLISRREHIAHALRHLYLYLAIEDGTLREDDEEYEDHLGNAACRVLFAISKLIEDGYEMRSEGA